MNTGSPVGFIPIGVAIAISIPHVDSPGGVTPTFIPISVAKATTSTLIWQVDLRRTTPRTTPDDAQRLGIGWLALKPGPSGFDMRDSIPFCMNTEYTKSSSTRSRVSKCGAPG